MIDLTLDALLSLTAEWSEKGSFVRYNSWCCASHVHAGGVGSAANAEVGLIVGYVGASHVAPESKEKHAKLLMAGRNHSSHTSTLVFLDDVVYWFPRDSGTGCHNTLER